MSDAGRRLVSTGSPFEKAAGYSRAVVQETREGVWVFVAGTTGYDYATMDMPDDAGAQAANCLATIETALAQGGLTMADVVRANYTVTDPAHAEAVFACTGLAFGDIRPAATMIVAGLIRPEMKVEIEVTAFRPCDRSG